MDFVYAEIKRLPLEKAEKTKLRGYFTKNPPQAEHAARALRTCADDEERLDYLRDLLEPQPGNDFVTRALGT